MDQIKAVIFDMDGVLIDAKEWHYEALNRALGNYGYSITRSEHISIYDGLPTRSKLQLLTERNDFPEELHESVNKQKQQYTLEIAREKCQPRLAHTDALEWLKNAGFSVGVASNSIRATVDMMLDKAGVLEYFDFTLSNEDVSHPKPHPEIYQTAISRLQLKPAECLVVEDHQYGVDAARQAGAHVLQVNTVDEVCRSRISDFISRLESSPVLGPLPHGSKQNTSSKTTTLGKAA